MYEYLFYFIFNLILNIYFLVFIFQIILYSYEPTTKLIEKYNLNIVKYC